ncbi:pyrroline-5-carboxylate reductase [Winkia neuii]|uniref:pyrroline-5-carboxylate reductase n=1 Tax=Winkia neuii TaxID=33007 RepID=UPI000764066D|nr:pyrroline-5-carboxylate reductase [Winkia neuii]KWZ72460.1 pyrroline-5-carboxylate reductase [Winkia neuii]
MLKVGILGTGSMGSAIARGIAANGADKFELHLYARRTASSEPLAQELGAKVAKSADELVASCDVTVVAVKPHQMNGVLSNLTDPSQTVIVSVAAGRSLQTLSEDLPACPAGLVRVMPNVNASIGRSMSGLAASANTAKADLEKVISIFNCCGSCEVIDESLFPAFAALAGCLPGWIFQLIDSFARAGLAQGIPKAQAVQIVATAMAGSAENVEKNAAASGLSPAALVDTVLSPAGTTVAGLLAAEEAGLSRSATAAVQAAVDRDNELAKAK